MKRILMLLLLLSFSCALFAEQAVLPNAPVPQSYGAPNKPYPEFWSVHTALWASTIFDGIASGRNYARLREADPWYADRVGHFERGKYFAVECGMNAAITAGDYYLSGSCPGRLRLD